MTFRITRGNNGYVSFTDGKVTLVRFSPSWKWEFYVVEQCGRCRGMETFVRYLTEKEGARLSAVVAADEARARLGWEGVATLLRVACR